MHAHEFPFIVPQIGDTIYAMLDPERTPLTVVRVEPMVVCRKPDGTEVMLFAHELDIEEGPNMQRTPMDHYQRLLARKARQSS